MPSLALVDDIAAVQTISSVPRILKAITEITNMRFACIARVTEASWTLCAVYDAAGFGLVPGNELPIDTTFCKTVRETGRPVVFDSANGSEIYHDHPSPKLYGFDSYASLPLYRSTGEFFGTLCALDPLPATPSHTATLATLRFFAELISDQLFAEEQVQSSKILHQAVSEQLRTTLQERAAAEQALLHLKESEGRFRAAMDAIGVMWTNDASGKMAGVQLGWSGLTGQAYEEYQGYGWAAAIHPDDAAPTISAWDIAVAEHRTFEFEHRVRRHDGVWRTCAVKAVPVIDEDGTVLEWVGVHTDITERRLSEQALATKEARLRLATDVAGLGIWTWEPSVDAVTWENDRIYTIFGVAKDSEAINAAAFSGQFLHADDVASFKTAVEKAMISNAPIFFQGRIYRADNQALRWVELHGEICQIRPGVRGVLGTITDVTERKKGQEALQALADELRNTDRRKSEFIATLAHELRNPLAPIRNAVQVLRMASNNPDTITRVTGVMERQIGQMVHLIDDLLDITRISRGQIELRRQVVDLKQIAVTAIEMSLPLIETRKHDLSVDISEEPVPLFADSGRIAQVISNLLTNAAKYTLPNGKINFTARQEDESAVITVVDTGIGIPEEALENVFDMFSQVESHQSQAQGGLGIGLALVRTLVHLHGGTVRAFSGGEGLGSTFVVRLPISQAKTEDHAST